MAKNKKASKKKVDKKNRNPAALREGAQPAAALINTLSPERSLSEITLVVNTLSEAQSLTPEANFGQAKVTTLSPAASLTPISVRLRDRDGGETFDVAVQALTPVGSFTEVSGGENLFNSTAFDTFLAARLLEPRQLLALDARQLFAVKQHVMQTLVSSPAILKVLKAKVGEVLAELKP